MSGIRRAVAGEAAVVTAVINAAYMVEAFFKIDPARTNEAHVAECIARDDFLVVEEEGAIVGCVNVRADPPGGYFGMLAVEPSRQGTGLARRLIEAAEALCRERGCETLSLTVVNLREELPGFYERFGFAITGTEPFPEPDELSRPAHFFVMSKSLAATPAPPAQEAAPWAPASH